MQKKQLISYFNQQCDIISDNLKKICKNGNQKALHDLRVAIKKIKAMAWLMDKCHKQDVLKNEVKIISMLFNEAGVIRNAQLYMAHMPENKTVHKRLASRQQQVIETCTAAFAANRKLYETHIHTLRDRLKVHAKSISFSEAKQIVQKRRKKIMLFLQTDIGKEPELLHTCRKQIKSVCFIHQVFLKFEQKNMLKHSSVWNKLQEAIGHWHDVKFIQQSLLLSKASKAALKEIASNANQKLSIVHQTSALLLHKHS
jgi:CHAD domain-containing protein